MIPADIDHILRLKCGPGEAKYIRAHIAAQDTEIERRHGIGGELIIARRERDDAIAERDALQARIDSAPVGQSLGMVIYHHDETIAAKMEGKRVALLAGE